MIAARHYHLTRAITDHTLFVKHTSGQCNVEIAASLSSSLGAWKWWLLKTLRSESARAQFSDAIGHCLLDFIVLNKPTLSQQPQSVFPRANKALGHAYSHSDG